jgi:hypothetical protein
LCHPVTERHKYRDVVPPVVGVERKTDELALQLKNIVAKSKDVKTGSNLAESSEEVCGSNRAVLPILMMMTMTMILYNIVLYIGTNI